MKYFCVSDIHGHLDILTRCLTEAGFDASNDNHMLMVIGDMVDRGPNSKEVIEFIMNLHKRNKAIVILGNHDLMLLNFFEGDFSRTMFDILKNGHQTTLKNFLGYEIDNDNMDQGSKEMKEKYPEIHQFLKELPLYLEIGDTIFVHGGVDADLEDWKSDTRRNFVWNRMYKMKPMPNKRVIVGHTPAVYCRQKPEDIDELFRNSPDLFKIHEKDGVIHIDGCVNITGNIEVFIVEL